MIIYKYILLTLVIGFLIFAKDYLHDELFYVIGCYFGIFVYSIAIIGHFYLDFLWIEKKK